MFVGKHTIKKNNFNYLSDAIHQHYGVVIVDGSTILLVACNPVGLISDTPSKLGVFSDNVESVAWSNKTSRNVYLSVQLRSQVNIFHVCSDSDSKPVFSQVLTFDLQSKSAGCIWHTKKPVICILHEDHAVVLNVTTKGSQKLRCNGGKVKTGTWTPDGSKLIIAINSTLKVFSWDDSSACEVDLIGLQDEIGGIRNVVTISNELVAIATDLPLEHLIKASADDMFEVKAIEDEATSTGDDTPRQQQHETSDNTCDRTRYDGQTEPSSNVPGDVCSKKVHKTDIELAKGTSLLINKLDLKSKGSIDLTELLAQVGKLDSTQTLAGDHCGKMSDESDYVTQNARFIFKTDGKPESKFACRIDVDEKKFCEIDFTNIKAAGPQHKEDTSTSLLYLKRKQMEHVTDSSQLAVIDLKLRKTLSKVNVPCIINPDLLTYLPGCHCLVIGSNSQPKLSVFKWMEALVQLMQEKDLELPPEENPVGVAAMSSGGVMVMSAKSDQRHQDAAFLSTSRFAPVDIHIRTMTIQKDAQSFRADQDFHSSDLQCLNLPTGNVHPSKGADGAKKMIEEIDTSEDISKKKFIEIGGMSTTQKDVEVQCEYNNYAFPSDLSLIHLKMWINGWINKSFILEEGCYLRLIDVKKAFMVSEAELGIGHDKWVYLSEDRDGFVKMKFKSDSCYNLRDCHHYK